METNILEFYKGIVADSPNMILAVDVDLSITLVNKTFDDFIKNTAGKKAIIGIKVDQIISLDNESMLKDMITNFTNALLNKNLFVIHKITQGKLIGLSFEMTFFPVKNDRSKIIGASCVAKDVTDREDTIISLKSSKNIFSLASRLANFAPWVFDVKNNVFIFNDEIYTLYGTSVKEVGLTMSPEIFAKTIVHPDEINTVQNFFEKVFKSKELESTFEFESRIVRLNDKKIRNLKVMARITRDSGGNILGFYGTNQDVTEQKATRENLRKIQLEADIIYNSVPAWITYKDKENRYIRVNQSFATAMGMPKEELEGKSLFDIYSKELAEKRWQEDKEVVSTGKAKYNIIELVLTKNRQFWLQTDKIPYFNENGEIIGIITFAVDITDRKKAENEVKEKLVELEKFNKMFVDREIKMIELKQEIQRLSKNSGQ